MRDDEHYQRGREQGEALAQIHTAKERRAMRAWMTLTGQAHKDSMRFLLFVQGVIDALKGERDQEG